MAPAATAKAAEAAAAVTISISDAFDGGNIKYIDQKANREYPGVVDVILHVKPDVYTELEEIAHMQYFSFRATIGGMDAPQRIKYIIDNAEHTSYPEAWPGTTVFYSKDLTDPESWNRNLDTFYTNGKLHWEHIHIKDESVYFCFFPPFPYTRHLSLIAQCTKYAPWVHTLGQSTQGREIDCIKVGTGASVCWIIHRQHPGETMAEFFAEGLLARLLGLNTNGVVDEQASRVLALYTFYIVPNMCPDGAVLGHLRANAKGANLNREWANKGDYEAPTPHRSPEVYYVLQKMDQTGVDLFLDIHGDEELPFNFCSGANHIPKWNQRHESLLGAFTAAYCRANSDMQAKIGYPVPETKEEVLGYMNVAANQVAERFDCLGLTIEMPYKDCWSNSDPVTGWTPARSRKLAESVLDPIEYIHPYLRTEDEFWTKLPPEDAYVNPTDDYQDEGVERGDEFIMLKKRFYSDVHEIRKSRAVFPTGGFKS